MQLNELLCPKCNERMFVLYDENDDYSAHGCRKCQMFYGLENFEEYER